MMKEIETKKDVELLVNSFYAKVLQDELISPFFKHMNFDHHLPKMVHFWSFVLLDEAGYTTDVTAKHMHMRLKQEYFDRWLALFNKTVDELFAGEKANAAKQRAYLVGWTISSKMNAQQIICRQEPLFSLMKAKNDLILTANENCSV